MLRRSGARRADIGGSGFVAQAGDVDTGEIEQQLRTLVREAPVAIAMFDRRLVYLACSDRWLADFGLTWAEIERRSHYDVFPEIPERWRAVHRRCLAGATESAEEDRFERHDGSVQWLRWDVRPWRDPRGEIGGLIFYSEDITARKVVEEALARREQEFRMLFDGITDHALYLLDARGHIRTWNAGAQRLLGYSAAEIIGQHVRVLYDEAAIATGQPERDLATAATHGVYEDEGLRHRKDGSTFWGNGVLRALGSGDALQGYAKVLRDMTQRHHSTLMLRAVLDCAADAIISIDESGTIHSFNRGGQRMFGYSPAEVIGANVAVLMPEPYASEHDGYLQRYIHTGEARIIGRGREAAARRKDGTQFPVALSVDEFAVDHQRYFAGIVRDLTDRNALEDQLRQAQKLEAVGRLAGGVAHDFNNLLSVILSHAELLQLAPSLEAPMREELEEIAKAGRRAAELTRQLLLFSRRTVIVFKRIELNAVIADLERMLRRLLREDIEFVCELAADVGCIEADRGLLEQVVMNLVVNARDAMPGGGRLRLSTSRVAPGDQATAEGEAADRVALVVEDTGVGMDAVTRERIFEPFFTTKAAGEGTGLGLSTVFGIVHQFGGDIRVDSAPNRGSRFIITLPVATGGAVVEPPRRRKPTVTQAATILVVEDDPSVRAVACAILRRAGYSVVAAASGPEALALPAAVRDRCDLVVSDVVMPAMNGFTLVEQLRRHNPRLKVLLMSGHIDDAALANPGRPADVPILSKPLTPDALAGKVREVLDAG
jgi:PAS domain S-box-containing protein